MTQGESMKVLLIDQIAKVNYKYTYPLANGLVKVGVDVELVIDQKEEQENCICDRIRLFNTDEKNISKMAKLFNYIKSYRKIFKRLKEGEFSILHTQWYTFSPIDYYFIRKIKRKCGIKYVATVHDILPFNEKFYDKYYHKKLYALADKIILQAPANMKRFSDIFQDSSCKTVMIPHGHMLDYVETYDRIESRKKLGISNNKLVFLFFGQIKKVKGVDILLKALLNIREKHKDIYVVIAGSVWKTDFSECENIINSNDLSGCLRTDIKYIPDEDIKYYYSAADVCVLPYIDIYQSGVIQLAFGYKKPVIATKLPAFTQYVKEDYTGYLADVGDIDSLVRAFEKAIENRDRLSEMGCNGHELVKRELDWSVLAKRVVDECYL